MTMTTGVPGPCYRCGAPHWNNERPVPASPDLVERVARAIFEVNSGPWEFCSEHGKAATRDEAEAAIAAYEATRSEPTE